MSSLDILPVRPPEDEPGDAAERAQRRRIDALDPRLPRPPFLGVLCGSVRTGKSTLIVNLLYNRAFYHGVFARVFFYSPTVRNDATLHHLLDDDAITVVDERLDRLDDVFAAIVEEKQSDRATAREQWLHIFDDCLGLLKSSGPKAHVTTFASRYRHSRNSMILSTQLYRALPPIVRANASWYAIWRTTNRRELEKLEDEFSGVFPNFLEDYERATAAPYSFLLLDLRAIKASAGF